LAIGSLSVAGLHPAGQKTEEFVSGQILFASAQTHSLEVAYPFSKGQLDSRLMAASALQDRRGKLNESFCTGRPSDPVA
jgi:hypothetical protein